jgi:hypothetical protein
VSESLVDRTRIFDVFERGPRVYVYKKWLA